MSTTSTTATPPADDVHLIVARDEEVVIEHHPEDWLAFVLFWCLAFIVFLQFFTRYILNDSLSWTEEIARYGLMWVVFIGGAMVTRRNTHIAVELLPNVMQIIRIRHSDNLHHSLTARPEELKITARRFFVWRTHENF